MSNWKDGTTAELPVAQIKAFRLIFAYQNYKDEDHVYMVQPISFAFAPYLPSGINKDPNAVNVWVMHAHCYERDGIPRVDGPVRRTFILSKVRDVIHVQANQESPSSSRHHSNGETTPYAGN